MTSAWRPPGHAHATWRRLLPTRAPTASAFCGVARGWPQLCTRTALSRRGAHGVPGAVSQSQGADRATAQAAEVKAGKPTQTMTPLDALWASHTDEATRCRMHRRRTGRGCASCAHAMAISRAGVRSLFAFQKATISARPQQDRPQTQLHVCAHAHVMCISAATSRLGSDASGHARPNPQANRSWDPMSDQIIKHWCRLHRGFAVFRPDGLGQSWHYRGRGPSFHTRVARCLHACGCCQVHSSRTIAASFNSTINGLDDSPIACSEARRKAQRGAADAIATGQSPSDFL